MSMQLSSKTNHNGCLNDFTSKSSVALKDDEVLVAVTASSLNARDVRKYKEYLKNQENSNTSNDINNAISKRLYKGYGFDMVGKVVKIGTLNSDLHVGDEVIGLINYPDLGFGFESEIVCKANDLVKLPTNFDPKIAACLPLSGLTAYQALFSVGKLQPGENVIILGAAGGVGHIVVQLAKNFGANVYAVDVREKHDYLRSLGVKNILDYEEDEFLRWQSEADLIVDLIGGQVAISALSLLNVKSRMVSVPLSSFASVKLAATNLSSEVLSLETINNVNELKELINQVVSNKININIYKEFSITELDKAVDAFKSSDRLGKVVLSIK